VIYTVPCPSCGAPVSFRSAASVMAVCGYCRASLVREAEAVRDIGKMAEAMEDYSPIQISTSGVWKNRPFGVVGRLQLRYDDGGWNEWYLMFEDGGTGWLGDASGQYTIMLDLGALPAPAFGNLRPGQVFSHGGDAFIASDVRTARCTGGAGELPFAVGQGWEAKVVDLRAGDRFLTLDYSDADPPRAYLGQAVTLDQLKCQLLRRDEDILKGAGRLLGRIANLACPGCGTSLTFPAGAAAQLVCPSCGSRSDASGEQAVLIEKNAELEQISSTLELGDQGKIDGVDYLLIGRLHCKEVGDEVSFWTEYLLYNAQKGFLWLVESDEGWDKVRVLDTWPETSGDSVILEGTRYKKLYDYGSEVIHATGAFNWRAKVGDHTDLTDYEAGERTLSRETTLNEQSWSLAEKVEPASIAQWFKKESVGGPSAAFSAATADKGKGLGSQALVYTLLMLFFNAPIALAGGIENWIVVLLALGLLWWPVISSKESEA
jgi:ribosomal protein S27E